MPQTYDEDAESEGPAPIMRVKGRCFCGEPFSINLEANHQILDVYFSKSKPGQNELSVLCKHCNRKMIVETGLGRESGSVRHPMERFIEYLSGGYRLGRMVVIAVISLMMLSILPTLIAFALGLDYRIFHLDYGLGYAFLAFTIMFLYTFLTKRLRKWYGAAEDNIPQTYKYHVQKNFELIFNPAFFALVTALIFAIQLWGGVLLSLPPHLQPSTGGTDIMNATNGTAGIITERTSQEYLLANTPDKIMGAIINVSIYVQLLLGLMFFLMGMVLPRYQISVRRPEKDYEDFVTEIKQIRNNSYLMIPLVIVSLNFGLVYYGYFLNEGIDLSISFLSLIFGEPVLLFLILFFFGDRVERKVREWHSQAYESERSMHIEVIPIGSDSRVEVESLFPPAIGVFVVPKSSDTRTDIVTKLKAAADQGNELAIFYDAVTSPKMKKDLSEKGEAIWKSLNSIGDKIFHTYFQEKARDAFIIGAKGAKGKLTIMFRCVGEDSAIPWELALLEFNPICLEHRVVRVHSHSPNMEFAQLAAEKVLIIASSETQDDSFVALEGVDAEAKAVKNAAEKSGLAVMVLKGKEATRKNVMDNINKGEYQILHFCGHSFYNREEPKYSSLILYDGKLTAQEIASIVKEKCPLQLIFLGSCFSGEKDPLSTEEITGISDAFAAAGIPYIIGMQWAVTDAGLELLSREFYTGITKGYSVEESLRLARLKTKDEWSGRDPVWAAPLLYKR